MKIKLIVAVLPLLLTACDKADGGQWVNKDNECLFVTADSKLGIHVSPGNHLYFTDFQEDCYELSGHTNNYSIADNPMKVNGKSYPGSMLCKPDVRYPSIGLAKAENEHTVLSAMLEHDKVKIDIDNDGKHVYTIPTKGLRKTCSALFTFNPDDEASTDE